jgi:hypothetical protein
MNLNYAHLQKRLQREYGIGSVTYDAMSVSEIISVKSKTKKWKKKGRKQINHRKSLRKISEVLKDLLFELIGNERPVEKKKK